MQLHHRVWELPSLRPGRMRTSRQSIQLMSLHQRPAAQLIRLQRLSMLMLSPMQPMCPPLMDQWNSRRASSLERRLLPQTRSVAVAASPVPSTPLLSLVHLRACHRRS